MIVSLPGLVGLVFVLAGFVFGVDWLKQHRESGRPSPSAAAPNVLFIVLDTVRADRLSLYGYDRPTTPALERWARQGILFSEARATAPWTLASHASLFTGRWPRELGVKWLTPLGTTVPTLAEYFGSRGYATAGFVANLIYCSYDTGLDRGFTHYEDYVLERLMALRTACLFDHAAKELSALSGLVDAGPFGACEPRSILAEDAAGVETAWHPRQDRMLASESIDNQSRLVLAGIAPMDSTPTETADRRPPARVPLSPMAAVLLAISFGLCGGYLDLGVIALQEILLESARGPFEVREISHGRSR